MAFRKESYHQRLLKYATSQTNNMLSYLYVGYKSGYPNVDHTVLVTKGQTDAVG